MFESMAMVSEDMTELLCVCEQRTKQHTVGLSQNIGARFMSDPANIVYCQPVQLFFLLYTAMQFLSYT